MIILHIYFVSSRTLICSVDLPHEMPVAVLFSKAGVGKSLEAQLVPLFARNLLEVDFLVHVLLRLVGAGDGERAEGTCGAGHRGAGDVSAAFGAIVGVQGPC